MTSEVRHSQIIDKSQLQDHMEDFICIDDSYINELEEQVAENIEMERFQGHSALQFKVERNQIQGIMEEEQDNEWLTSGDVGR